jgi:carbamoyl-phosphate synthase large subunit
VCDRDKRAIVGVAKHLQMLGYDIVSTRGTARILRSSGVEVEEVHKVHEGRPNIVDSLKNGDVQLVINTPFGRDTRSDGYHIRTAASNHRVPNVTTVPAAQAIVQALEAMRDGDRLEVCALQDFDEWKLAVGEAARA